MTLRDEMKLKTSEKVWIFHNIKHFFRQDAYLKFIDSEVLLQSLKKELKKASTLEELLQSLPDVYNKSFKFYRKDGKYFIYPSITFQVETLLKTWSEIVELKKIVSEVIETEDQEEEEDNVVEQDKITYSSRNCYGQTTNIYSSPIKNEDKSLKSHILSRVSNVKISYIREYARFKRRIINVCKSHFEEGKAAIVFQTDIKSFYHNIDTKLVVAYLENYYYEQTKNLRATLKKLQENTGSSELPIGWILSGPISDILLNIVHQKLSKYKEMTFISYVDDFVVIKNCKPEDLNTEFNSINDVVIDALTKAFDDVFSKSKINFHKEGEKTKKWKFTKDDLGIMDLSWFDINDISSIELDLKWNSVNEFLLPSDNDLNLNERVQFLDNLRNIKRRVQSGEIRTWNQFEEYFKKIIYKISSSGVKYIPTIIDTLMTFYITNSLETNECLKRIEHIYETTKKHNPAVNVWLSIFSSLKPYKDQPEITKWVFQKCEILISELSAKSQFQECELLCSWAILFKEGHPLEQKFEINLKSTLFVLEEVFQLQNQINYFKHGLKDNFDEKNEFLICNSLIYLIYHNKKINEASGLISNLFEIIPRDTLEEFLKEGLYLFSKCLNNADLIKLRDDLSKTSGLSQAAASINELVESLSYAEKYIYEMTFNEKIVTFKNFYNSFYSRSLKVPKFIQSLSRDRLYFGQREIVALQLHLSSDIDNWKRIFLGRYTSFDFSNYISSKFSPSIYPEIGFVLFFTMKEISDIKVSNIILAKNTQDKIKLLKKVILQNLKTSFQDNIIELNANNLHRLSRDGLESKMQNLVVTLSPLDFDIDKDYVPENGYGHSPSTITELRSKINQSLEHAIRAKAHFLVFPELCIPRQELKNVLEECGKHNIILIAGVEAKADSLKNYQNTTVISFPVIKNKNPLNNPYLAFFQHKNYPAPAEEYILRKNGYNYIGGKTIYNFNSSKYGSFAVLTCSDFLSTKLRFGLKSKIQLLFVPAVNQDNSTYNAVSESTMRELFCFCVVCNNARKGSTTVMAPYHEPYLRNVFTIHGLNIPGYSTIQLNVAEIKEVQNLTPFDVATIKKDENHSKHKIVKNFKQLPPDWEEFKKK